MQMQVDKLIMVKDDFNKIMEYINETRGKLKWQNDSLLSKINEAEVVEPEDFPPGVVRLNTRVVIKDKDARYNFAYTVVLPEHADHRKCKVSVFSPIGSALFGHRTGNDTCWDITTEKRYFTIVKVSQTDN